jgi:hypothetical protein
MQGGTELLLPFGALSTFNENGECQHAHHTMLQHQPEGESHTWMPMFSMPTSCNKGGMGWFDAEWQGHAATHCQPWGSLAF